MKYLAGALLLASLHSVPAAAKEVCACKCVVKEEDGTLSIEHGNGVDREAAGEDLKKNLKKKKCELSPDCSGGCKPSD